ncbi:MAG: adenylate kinase [Tenericutes bacterium]|nr:adenylate kinase [Mycoplasmatota bacterium]
MKSIIFIAPPAAGKGTQSSRLSKEFNLEHISTGDLLREEVKKGNTELKQMMESGSLVNDDIILTILKNKLETVNDYILDGFPRNLNQAIALDEMLKQNNTKIDSVIYLDLDKETAKKRIVGRVSCPKCGNVYNTMIDGMNSKVNMICDDCKSSLVKRSDDNEETFNVRFDTYMNETAPLIEYYQNKGNLYQIDSSKNPEEVYQEIKKVLYD